MATPEEQEGRWVTIKGRRVFIKEGETLEEALKQKETSTSEDKAEKKKSTLSDYIKQRNAKDIQFFFGDTKQKTNKYFTFKRVQDDDNIVFLTDNVKVVKENPVLFVAENKGVFLKDWQVKKVHNYDNGINTTAVKLSRKYFKPYTFNFKFEEFAGMDELTFDDLLKIAKEQDKTNMPIALGWMNN